MATQQVAFESGPVDVEVEIETREDIATAFGYASGPAICPPEIDYPVHEQTVTLTFSFPVTVWDTRLANGVLTLGLERTDAEDYANMTLNLDYPFAGEEEYDGLTAQGAVIEIKVRVIGDESVSRRGAVYERHSW